MREGYEDIRERIAEEPKWFDSDGVPRYDEPHPRFSPNIYAEVVVFFEIVCAACGEVFLVEKNRSGKHSVVPRLSLAELVQDCLLDMAIRLITMAVLARP